MLDWLRKQAGKLFREEQEEQTARSVGRCLSELAQLRQDLDRELAERTWSVDKIVIEKLQADKVELNLGSLDIGELSGMLSIGFNYGGRLVKVDSKGGGKTEQQPLQGKAGKENPAAQPITKTMGKDDVKSKDNYNPGTTSKPKNAQPEKPARTSVRPHLNIRYRQ
jgi:hypothetical protein